MADKYAIRRAIVAALYAFANPTNLAAVLSRHEIILAFQRFPLTNDDVIDLRREWNWLIDRGCLVPVPGYDDYCKLSGDLRSLLAASDPLTGCDPLRHDERFYGPAALR